MNHLHFETLNSTQSFLKENVEQLLIQDKNILITCDNQTDGIGRTGNRWLHNPNSIAMSFTLKPNQEVSLSTIEIGLLVLKYIKSNFHFDVKLKWPNDLMNAKAEKIGGIISNFQSKDVILVGLGINFGELQISTNDIKNKISSVPTHENFNSKEISLKIYEYILQNRLSLEEILNGFNSNCIHFEKQVAVDNIVGKFIGIKKDGSALLESNKKILSINSGHLFLMN